MFGFIQNCFNSLDDVPILPSGEPASFLPAAPAVPAPDPAERSAALAAAQVHDLAQYGLPSNQRHIFQPGAARIDSTILRLPLASGFWWSVDEEAWTITPHARQRVSSQVGRMMETSLGVRRAQEDACEPCRESGLECWVWIPNVAQYMMRPGSTCARCRFHHVRSGGCDGVSKYPVGSKRPGRK